MILSSTWKVQPQMVYGLMNISKMTLPFFLALCGLKWKALNYLKISHKLDDVCQITVHICMFMAGAGYPAFTSIYTFHASSIALMNTWVFPGSRITSWKYTFMRLGLIGIISWAEKVHIQTLNALHCTVCMGLNIVIFVFTSNNEQSNEMSSEGWKHE